MQSVEKYTNVARLIHKALSVVWVEETYLRNWKTILLQNWFYSALSLYVTDVMTKFGLNRCKRLRISTLVKRHKFVDMAYRSGLFVEKSNAKFYRYLFIEL